MSNNFFNFFPVGQGLFYCGILNNGSYSFVYDCGTKTHHVNLQSYINFLHKWNAGRRLNFLAISHFHEDHINGIKYLEKTVGFERVYIPYICDDSIVRSFLIGIEYFGLDIDNEEESNFQRNIEDFSYIFSLIERENVICLKDYTMLSNSGWEFKFFNKPIPVTLEARLLAEIQSLMTSKSIANIIDLFKQGYFKEIRDIYNRVFTKVKLHETCLVLLHYPSIIPLLGYTPYSVFYPNSSALPFPYDFRHYFYPYTLLTGDIIFDSTFASEIISNYPTGISGFVQVPHHGSAKNSTSLLSNFPIFNCYVTTFGIGNIYGHPDPSLKIKIHPISYYEVTDYSGFQYWIFI